MKPLILIVDDQESIVFFLEKTLADEGYEVRTATRGRQALQLLEQEIPDLVLLDLKLPDLNGLEVLAALKAQFAGMCVVMITAFGEIETAVQAMKAGAYDYVNKPINLEQLLVVIRKGLESSRTERDLYLRRRHEDLFGGDRSIVPSQAPAMEEVYETVRKIAVGQRTTILIEGESGVGKDVVATIIHNTSARRDEPFLEVNCAALPEKLLESELFGHEKGAFTDAVQQKPGLLELAHKGTLFLDEIGELSVPIQVKLLRVLEKMTFRRLGGVKDISVDVRILSATNQDLGALVRAGRFREDLYYRLKVIPLRIPPLRDRQEDILLLAEHFLRQFSLQFRKAFTGLSPLAAVALREYDWPGNIRELKNVIERAVLLEEGPLLEPAHLGLNAGDGMLDAGFSARLQRALLEPLPPSGVALEELVSGLEIAMIRKAYQASGNNQTFAARLLGLNRDKLRYRMKTYDITD
ncbi:MAG: sigma-54-dependent transcriptional regulator [Candidatus Krumholzibacteriia bacterium]